MLLNENMGKYLHDLGLGKGFLNSKQEILINWITLQLKERL